MFGLPAVIVLPEAVGGALASLVPDGDEPELAYMMNPTTSTTAIAPASVLKRFSASILVAHVWQTVRRPLR
jgi:hypothetical protein